MTDLNRRISSIRRSRNEIESHIIDEYAAGRIGRREFFQRGAMVGMSLPLLSVLAAACGGSSSSSSSSSSGGAAPATSAAAGGGKTGGTIRISILKPNNAVDPLLANNTGSLGMLAFTGEFLTMDEDKQLKPWLAESWTSNADASEWTFKIKSGVKFNDGTPMTAKDVAATFNRLADPKNKSNALSTLGGVLTTGNATAPDDTTVVFKLDSPNGSFPYYTSNDNYNAIILPASYAGGFTKTWPGTGPWKNTAYTEGQSAAFSANPDYWGPKPKQATLQVTMHPDEGSAVTALQSGQVDAVQQISVSGGQAILNDPNYTVLTIQASTHRELSMRCDKDPFTDKRVRQAIALTLDRPQIVQGLFQGKSDLGNDSPFAPVFAQTDTSIAQRAQDIAKAKQLLSDAGHGSGFSTQLVGVDQQEIKDYAQLVAESAKQIGVNISLKIEGGDVYYGNTFGSSDWLDSIMSLVDYGHRGVPNLFLTAPLQTYDAKKGTGVWNAAHFANAQYDKLVADYIAAVDLPSQKKLAGQIETLLLDETPIIFAYFYNYLAAAKKNVQGLRVSAMSQIWPDQVTL
jgi:peptide/nickel transport system substrate-binding protein